MPATVLDGFQLAHFRGAGRGMAVQVDGYINSLCQIAYQVCRYQRCEKSGHILYCNTLTAHVCQLPGHVNDLLDAMNRAGGITDGALGVFTGTFYRLDGSFQVSNVIQGIEYPKHVDTVLGRAVDKSIDNIVRVMPVSQQVLAAQQHLQAR